MNPVARLLLSTVKYDKSHLIGIDPSSRLLSLNAVIRRGRCTSK